jgi:hypothetical protein
MAGSEAVAIDANHQSICKPENKNAPIHCSIISDLNSLISELRLSVPEAEFTSDDYSSKYERDRRSLEEKLQAANRSDEYQRANEHQNKFAQDYMRNGLSLSAKQQNDNILAEVQQRFETHIYPLISEDIHHPDISTKLQSEVIDPVTLKFEGNTNFTTQTVQRAVYYLTEQCHIRWDPE